MIQSFYGKLAAEGYDIDDQRHDALAFYQQQWELLGRPTPILEPMCGTGFFLIPFLEAGADIDGLDASPYMLAACQAKCATQGFTPTLYEQPLESMDLPRPYAYIFIPDRSFALIYTKAIAQHCLERIAASLRPGGWFVVEIKTPPKHGEFGSLGYGQPEFRVEDRPDGSTLFVTSLWSHRDDGRVVRIWTKMERYLQGAYIETEIFDYNERFYNREEFTQMLLGSGFVNVTAVRAYDRGEPEEHDVLVYSCQKP